MEYTEKVMDHFKSPRNMGRMENPDGVGTVGNPVCGDVMKIYLRVKDDRIADVSFETFGCGAAIATSSVATELVKGKTLAEAEQITNKDVVNVLGGLPPVKMHCSLLAEEGLRAAIKDYRDKQCATGKEGKTMELKEKIEEALKDVRGFLQQDGGDCEVVEITEDGTVKMRLKGACHGCPFASITLKMRIERIIKERVPEVKEVVAVE